MLTPLLIATHNSGKIKEFKKLLTPPFSVLEPASHWSTPIENGTSYLENAEIKARSLWELAKKPVLSDDSGLEIDWLNGEPGIHSAYYGGENLTWPQRWQFILEKMSAARIRTARFRAVLCYFDGTLPQFFEGIVEGEIAMEPKGREGFGYDPIFLSKELGKSFGEASKEEKSKISHRYRAVQRLIRWWNTRHA